MQIGISQFQGAFPRVAKQLLPDNAAQMSENCRFLSGNLQAWNGFADGPAAFTKSGTPNHVHLMASQYWLHWVESELGSGQISVDVARGPIAADVTERTYFTGTDVPRVTNIEMATTGGTDYPEASLKLGVPAPTVAPELAINEIVQDQGNITITNPGAETGDTTGWTQITGDFGVTTTTPRTGTYAFTGGVASSTIARTATAFNLASLGVSVGQRLRLQWYTKRDDTVGGFHSMGFQFFNTGGTMIEEYYSQTGNQGAGPNYLRSTINREIPATCTTFRIVMRFSKIDAGDPFIGVYIDDITLSVVENLNSFDGSNLTGWQLQTSSGATVAVDGSFGQTAPSIKFMSNGSTAAMYRAAGTNISPKVVLSFDCYIDTPGDAGVGPSVLLFSTASGQGAGLRFNPENIPAINIVRWNGWNNAVYSQIQEVTAGPLNNLEDVWLTCDLVAERTSPTTANLTVSLRTKDGATTFIDNQTYEIPTDGDYIGFRYNASSNMNDSFWLDNVSFIVTPGVPNNTTGAISTNFTNYVFTYVNELGEEGPPSPVSRVVQVGEGVTVTVTLDVSDPDSEYGIVSKRLYRAVTGEGTTEYQFIEELDLDDAEYSDTKKDEDLGEILITVDWDLPPSDGHSIIALPNGIMMMASKNQIVPSVINRPHAYPQPYRLNTDSDVVAIAAIDSTVVVGTETSPYVVVGSDPANLSMTKFEQRQACVSKRSMVSIRQYGIIYASPDGLVAINGAGNLTLITEPYFTREEWQAIEPEKIIAFAHDDRYFAFFDGEVRGFIFDPRQLGNGLTWLSRSVFTGHSDPLTDRLYIVNGAGEFFIWNEDDENPIDYIWKSKVFQLPRPANFSAAQVRADNYEDLTFRLYVNQAATATYTKDVTSEMEFVLPDIAATNVEVRLDGTSPVRFVQIAEDMEELE